MKLSELIRGFLADNSLSSHPRQVSLVEYAEEMETIIEKQGRANEALRAQVGELRDYIQRGAPMNTNPEKCERVALLAKFERQQAGGE
jgi:hypothetical protein